MPTDEFKKAVSELAPCHRCGRPGALTSTKGYPFCSNSSCILFRHKMPPSTWNLLAECSNVIQIPSSHNANLQRVVDAMLYIWHNRQDTAAIGALEDVISDYEQGRPESHSASLLEHAAFKAKKYQDEIDELKKENRRLERNSITIDGKVATQAAVNALIGRVESSKKQLQSIEVWAVEDEAGYHRYYAFHRWMCDKWIEENEEVYPDATFGIVCVNINGVPDLYGEGLPEQHGAPSSPPVEEGIWKTVREAQSAAEYGLKKVASEDERSRAQLRVTSALLSLLTYTLTQNDPKV